MLNILGIMATVYVAVLFVIGVLDSKLKFTEKTWKLIRIIIFLPVIFAIAFIVLIMVLAVWSGIMFPWE